MKILNVLKATALAAILSFSSMAKAELIMLLDFNALANELGDTVIEDNPATFDLGAIVPGLMVTITATPEDNYHYLDEGTGLGICDTLDGCVADPSDNANVGEGFIFEFTLDDVAFVAEGFSILVIGHDYEGGIMEGTVVAMSDGGEFMPTNDVPVYTYSEASDMFSLEVTAGEIYLASIWFDDGSLPPQGIPEPANILLMSLALIGLVASRKKMQK
ncbi:PEP-CTERM sorting domain-containing protein [Thalassotalea litorea]|uniref:PEP-CTERM sorting domain-containing protein n=1 Tax=Thalassotalea litorea TaxID=2020715 RepID=A0A5R9IJQ6_9GAMM|nr:PEP-CTERM sorting domain-containing protein [Thalassotalea litorea]TLU64839.1 PEP-CTERM sorting domain-containing protein [Thalassotalea litorea]